MHVHVGVVDIDRSIRFYSTLFATEPTVRKPDYAKWMIEDPRVNFAISTHAGGEGVRHLGIQVESGEELSEVYGRLEAADAPVLREGETTCCYAKSEKSWITDPQGVIWEAFHTTGEATTYGGSRALGSLAVSSEEVAPAAEPCCGPTCCAP
jgi:hypothetical protein